MEEFLPVLGWMLLLNTCILLLSTIALVVFKRSVKSIHLKLFKIPEQELEGLYFDYLARFKIAVIVFNLTPYLALLITTAD